MEKIQKVYKTNFDKVTDQKVPYKITERRSGDIVKCFAYPKKANKELG
ncbi:hypothetical protein Q3V94_11775 [Caloramator sp. CAR-1]|nr:hypothetical protein [Caloramator sp. CAR-1]MDO6355734.1 hypothetical protein [Caloramator sp. CAR-1]